MRTGRAARPTVAARFASMRKLMPRGVEASRERRTARSAFKPQAAAIMARQAKPHSLISPCITTGTRPRGAADEVDAVLIVSVSSSENDRRGSSGYQRQSDDDPAFKRHACSPGVPGLPRRRGLHRLWTKYAVVIQVLAVAIRGRRSIKRCRHLILHRVIHGLAQAGPKHTPSLSQTLASIQSGTVVLGEPGTVPIESLLRGRVQLRRSPKSCIIDDHVAHSMPPCQHPIHRAM